MIELAANVDTSSVKLEGYVISFLISYFNLLKKTVPNLLHFDDLLDFIYGYNLPKEITVSVYKQVF